MNDPAEQISPPIRIRLLVDEDDEIRQVNEIYNEAVKIKFQTADTVPVSLEDRIKWVHAVNPQENPVYTAILDNHVLGWLSVRPYRESRAALKRVKEVSYYVSPAWQQKGIGKALLAHAIAKAPALNIGTFLAIVLEKNLRSIGLLEKFGFFRWGFLPRVAEFDGEYCGHCYYGLHLE